MTQIVETPPLGSDGPRRTVQRDRRKRPIGLQPALLAVSDAASYLGVGTSTFYAKFLPSVETVLIGTRRLVVKASLDQLVEQLRAQAASE